MSPAETIDKLCEMLSIAQTIIGQQAEMLMMHGIETYDGNFLEKTRGQDNREVEIVSRPHR